MQCLFWKTPEAEKDKRLNVNSGTLYSILQGFISGSIETAKSTVTEASRLWISMAGFLTYHGGGGRNLLFSAEGRRKKTLAEHRWHLDGVFQCHFIGIWK